LSDLTAHRRLCHYKLSLRRIDSGLLDCDLHAIRLRIELDQNITFFHAVVVVNQNASDLSAHARCHESYIAIHVSVVGRDRVPRMKNSRDDHKDNYQRTEDNERDAQSTFSCARIAGDFDRVPAVAG
jgi:hypothetical protein